MIVDWLYSATLKTPVDGWIAEYKTGSATFEAILAGNIGTAVKIRALHELGILRAVAEEVRGFSATPLLNKSMVGLGSAFGMNIDLSLDISKLFSDPADRQIVQNGQASGRMRIMVGEIVALGAVSRAGAGGTAAPRTITLRNGRTITLTAENSKPRHAQESLSKGTLDLSGHRDQLALPLHQ